MSSNDKLSMKTIYMSREQHKLWTDALRSGEYLQYCGGALEGEIDAGVAYCCLGVLQKVLSGDVERSSVTGEAMMFPSPKWLSNNNITFVGTVPSTTGTGSCSPRLELGLSASQLNDSGIPFSCIASIIDKCVEFTD